MIATQNSDHDEIVRSDTPNGVSIDFQFTRLPSGEPSGMESEDITEAIFDWIKKNPETIDDPPFPGDYSRLSYTDTNVGIPVKGSADHPPLTVWVHMILQTYRPELNLFRWPADSFMPKRTWYVDHIWECDPS